MGSPKKQRKKFSKPAHPWQKERILAEKELLKEYGLNRKYEIWKMNSILKNFTRHAKNLTATKKPHVEEEKIQFLTKPSSLGLIGKDKKIEDVLSLTLKDIMERRLQTLVCRKNIASNLKQSRQFIVHEHISIGDKTVTSPSYLVPLNEEGSIQFAQNSVFSNPNHPGRIVANEKKKSEKAKEKDESKVDEAKKKELKKEGETKAEEKEDKISKKSKKEKQTRANKDKK